MKIRIDQIRPSRFATRPTPLEVKSLAESIEKHGQLQPIRVRPVDGNYECVFGTRRLAAMVQMGLSEIEVTIQEMGDRQARLQIWEENHEREDLDDVARAGFLRAYREDYGLLHGAVQEQFGLSESYYYNLLRLLDEPDPIIQEIRARRLPERTVRTTREVLGKDDPQRVELLQESAEKDLGFTETVARARAIRYQRRTSGFKRKDADWQELPSVKELVTHIRELREWLRLGRAMVREEKLAPEAKRFIANKLAYLIRSLQEWKEELEGGEAREPSD